MNDAFGRPQSVVALGGTSDIARELVARLLAPRGRSAVLAGRDPSALERAAKDLGRDVARVRTVHFDASEDEDPASTLRACTEELAEPVDVIVVAVGELGTQTADEEDPRRVAQMVTVNFAWPAAALCAAATFLRRQGHGRIIVLTSVAGYRVRRSNFLYGSAKAGLDAFATGLSESLRGTQVEVHIVRPGFVYTKMTAGRSAPPFAVRAEKVASDIVQGVERGKKVIWTPSVLGLLFPVLRFAPQAVWRRMPG
jgi:decaprenylphospho-beta-D-erythro-pentofuranosid-2-ulose 2-reductase